jgi:hypothetical protein
VWEITHGVRKYWPGQRKEDKEEEESGKGNGKSDEAEEFNT